LQIQRTGRTEICAYINIGSIVPYDLGERDVKQNYEIHLPAMKIMIYFQEAHLSNGATRGLAVSNSFSKKVEESF